MPSIRNIWPQIDLIDSVNKPEYGQLAHALLRLRRISVCPTVAAIKYEITTFAFLIMSSNTEIRLRKTNRVYASCCSGKHVLEIPTDASPQWLDELMKCLD